MSEPLLRLDGVSKTYPPTARSGQRLRAFWQLLARGHSTGGTPVIQDISFEVSPGESMAVIGANGAGKSTLLKMITGVLEPSGGLISHNGSRAALLELGAGFDPEYTGMDNLRLNAAFLGLNQAEVAERLDDILAFADIGDSIFEPVKHYSSGMVVRLGFAVVASVRPDLLITDEVLAVGDESFQKKCIRWIEGYVEQGGTLLMVSHNMYQVQKLCRHALWLEGGCARAMGDVFDVTQSYLAWHERKDAADQTVRQPSQGMPYVKHLEIVEPEQAHPVLGRGQGLTVRAVFHSPDDRPPVVQFGLVRADGTPVFGISSDDDEVLPVRAAANEWEATVTFSQLPLLPGDYFVRICAMDAEGLRACDISEADFSVRFPTRQIGLVRLRYDWHNSPSAGNGSEKGDEHE